MNFISDFYGMLELYEKILLLFDLALALGYIIYLNDKFEKSSIIEIKPKRQSDAFISTLPYHFEKKEKKTKTKIAS